LAVFRRAVCKDWKLRCNLTRAVGMQLAYIAAYKTLFAARSSKEADVPKIRSSRGWRSIACAAAGVTVAGVALAQQDDGRRRVTTIDHAVEFYISDDAMQAQYVRMLDLGELGETQVRGGFFYNEDRDLIATGDLLASVGDEVGVRDLEVRVGTRVYGAFLAPEDQDTFGVGLGGEAQYFLNSARTTSVTLGLFYAPDIATFGTADNVKDASLRIMARLRNGTDVFAGFRTFEIDMEPEDREVDDNMHVGFRRSF
jgi:hypothetical protein